ncbi:MAG: hypothetical protein KAS04_03950, partial [Candidatus Aenigmarchaeota archaeon]|nr:hypothetical protein [Candidatus Aenigmarchaeota archaeon]
MPNSYEHSYQHDLDNVIDASDAVLAIGTEKVDTTTLKDRSLSGNDATIYGAMRASGYFDGGRILDGVDDYLDVEHTQIRTTLQSNTQTIICLFKSNSVTTQQCIAGLSKTIGTTANKTSIVGLINSKLTYDTHNISSIVKRVQTDVIQNNQIYCIFATYDGIEQKISIDGGDETTIAQTGMLKEIHSSYISQIGRGNESSTSYDELNGSIFVTLLFSHSLTQSKKKSFFNTLARLPLYSHRFTQYPNSDTSLTSIFPYTSGIITSGSFNKT